MQTQSQFTVRKMAAVGVLAALVFAASSLSFPIPTPLGNTRLHLGNVMCLLSGLLLGPVSGGLAAGIGSAFFDLTNPLYISSLPFTLVFKFLMAYVCGKISWGGGTEARHVRRNTLAAALGAITYVILYVGKNFVYDYFFLRTELQTALIDLSIKASVSGFNALLAVVIAVPLGMVLRQALGQRLSHAK